jgi:hypothetical protein
MNLEQVGEDTSIVEITNISPFGVWVYFADHEYFLDYDNFPWFRDARIKEVMNIQALSEEHLYWPDLDIDLHLDSIKNPQMYPLIYQVN